MKAKPSVMNRECYEWQTATICMLIPENDKVLALRKAREELSRRQWDFVHYLDRATLIESRVEELGGEVWEAYQYAKQGNLFFTVFHDHFGAGEKEFRPFLPPRITEKFIDLVVIKAGGSRYDTSVSIGGKKAADYIVGDYIFELKDLQHEGFENAVRQKKIANLFKSYFPSELEIEIDPTILTNDDYLKYLNIMSGPIQTHIKYASKQIKETRQVLGNSALKGGIIFLNTGFGSLSHDLFESQVKRYANKDSKQFEATVSISIWSITNGFDSNIFYQFSPQYPTCEEVNSLRENFENLFLEMMSKVVVGELRELDSFIEPLKPVAFNVDGIDFYWAPTILPLPWDDGDLNK